MAKVMLWVETLLLPELDEHKHLLGGTELVRTVNGAHTILVMEMPNAPKGATRMNPWFVRDGKDVFLGCIDWADENGDPIPTTYPEGADVKH
jgi:hypothetical protein